MTTRRSVRERELSVLIELSTGTCSLSCVNTSISKLSLSMFASICRRKLGREWLSPITSCRRRRTRCLLTTSATSEESNQQLVRWQIHPLPPLGAEDKNKRAIGSITLQSPKTFNALTVEVGQEFRALVRDITDRILSPPPQDENYHEITSIVLTGQGEQAFSAGGNLAWLRSLKKNSVHANADAMLQFYKSFLCVRSLPVPVICALQGPAMGAGAGLALACDLRTAADRPKILGLNFTRLGIHAGMGGSHLLASMNLPSAVMNEILLMGDTLSGQRCFELGLVNRLVHEDAKQAAFDLAEELSKRHPVAVRTMIQTIRQRQDEGLEAALQREALIQALCYARGDWPEGVNAVAEKRDAIFDPYYSK